MSATQDRRLREKAFAAVRAYYEFRHAARPFVPGQTYVPASGKAFDARELVALTDTALDFWLTADRYARDFESRLARRLGAHRVLLVNSGSSANLLAMAALADRDLGTRRLKPGDEVVTTAACFPTTLAPIIQLGLVPVLVDVSIPTYNATAEAVAAAISSRDRPVTIRPSKPLAWRA